MSKFHIKTKKFLSGKIEVSVYYSKRRIANVKLLDINQPASYILYLNVEDRFMNRGIGTFLMNEIIRKSLIRGCRAISLYVKIDNENAIRFYKNHGFFISLFSPKKDIGDHYLMTKVLTPI